MKSKEENIDRLFREGFRNFKESPPEEVWKNVLSANSSKKKKRLYFLKYAAASILLLLLAGSVYLIVNLPGKEELVAVNSETGSELKSEKEKKSKPESQRDLTAKEDDAKSVVFQPGKNTPSEKHSVNNIKKRIPVEAQKENISSTQKLNSNIPKKTKEIKDNLFPEDLNILAFIGIDPIEVNNLNINKLKGVYNNEDMPLIGDLSNDPGIDEHKRESYWSMGAKFSPLYSSRNVTMSMPGNFKNMYDEVEEGIIAYTGGFNFKYEPSGRISIHAGLFYSKMGQKVTDLVAFDVPASIASTFPVKGENKIILNSSFGQIFAAQTSLYIEDMAVARVENTYSRDYFDPNKVSLQGFNTDLIQSFEYVEIPLMLSYKVIDRTIDFQILGGVSTNVLVGNNVFADINGRKINIGETKDVYNLNYSSIFGLGIEYGFSEQLSLSLEPTFKYYLNSLSSGSKIQVHPFSIGVFSGISYKF